MKGSYTNHRSKPKKPKSSTFSGGKGNRFKGATFGKGSKRRN